jgi:hypothetical protein
MNPRLRAALVAVLASWLLVTVVPSIAQLWAPLGSYGFSTNYNNVVHNVAPHGAAARAGLRIGDTIDVMRLAPDDRKPYRSTRAAFSPHAGEPLALPIVRDGRRTTLHLVSQAQHLDALNSALLVLRTLSALVFVAVGAGLVLMRPSVMTWAFYLYCIGTEPGSVLSFIVYLPRPWATIQAIAVTAAGDLALLGALSFAIRFPNEATSLLRRRVEIAAAIVITTFAATEAIGDYLSGAKGMRMQHVFDVTYIVSIVFTAMIYLTFFVTYMRAHMSDRERIRYVIAGFTVALASQLGETLVQNVGHSPFWIASVLDLMGVIVPIAVAYAVIRHRVMDVSFVVSRTIVYGILTGFVFIVYSIIDWVCTSYVSSTGVENAAQVIASVAIGFSLSKLQNVTDRFVDRLFFRQRYDAEAEIRRLTAALPHTDTMDEVVRALVHDASKALKLSSAAVFLRSEATGELYERADACGWDGVTVERLFSDEQIVGKLARTGRLTTIGDLDLDGCALPEGIARPVLGLPIVAHEALAAVVLYGQHTSGATLDPEEQTMLDRLADAAAAAYDHIEALRLREEITALNRTVHLLERRLTGGEPAPANP